METGFIWIIALGCSLLVCFFIFLLIWRRYLLEAAEEKKFFGEQVEELLLAVKTNDGLDELKATLLERLEDLKVWKLNPSTDKMGLEERIQAVEEVLDKIRERIILKDK